jgi:hypothetical protein
MGAFRNAVTACAVAGAGLVLAAVPAGSALAAGTARTAAPAQAATAASPATTAAAASGTACTTKIEFPVGYYDICFRIEGQGLRIETSKAWMVNNTISDEFLMHFEIIGPSGHILNCDRFDVRALKRSPDCSWDPHADVTGGRYCAKLWQRRFGGPPPYHYFQVGINTCIDVRP